MKRAPTTSHSSPVRSPASVARLGLVPAAAGTSRRLMLALAAAALVAGGAPSAFAQSAIVSGCNELLAGEIGVRELTGAVGDSVDVAVTVHSLGTIDAFGLDLAFPAALLSYVDLSPGNLTAGFTNLSAQESGGVVTIGGFTLGPGIPPAVSGRLAHLRFVVIGAGTGAFTTSGYVDDLAAYDSCESVHGPSAAAAESWAGIKARFQATSPGSR